MKSVLVSILTSFNENLTYLTYTSIIGQIEHNYKYEIVIIVNSLYKEYYEKSLRMLNQGGLIIIDNVLWHGEVVDEKNNDKFTVYIREFNKFVSEDKRVEQIIIPLGDGMTICRVL